jgi:glycosyltransferase involved in cell wall biosynthesis
MTEEKPPSLHSATENDELKRHVEILERNVTKLQEQLFEFTKRSWRKKLEPKLWQYVQYPPRAIPELKNIAEQSPLPDPPTMAVVTPSHNYARFLAYTIDSVLAQKYSKLSYFVQDNASTDGTRNLLESYASSLSWSSEPDTGQANAVNRGFRRLDGEIMAYLNSDDVFLPGTLAYIAKAFMNNPQVDVVYGQRIYINENGLEIGRCVLPPHDPKIIKWADYIPQETMFWRRRVWEKVGPLDESFDFAMDWDFILRAQAAGFRFKRLPRFLAGFRVHAAQKSTARVSVGQEESNRLRLAHLGRAPRQREIDNEIKWYLRRHVLFHRLYKLRLLKY